MVFRFNNEDYKKLRFWVDFRKAYLYLAVVIRTPQLKGLSWLAVFSQLRSLPKKVTQLGLLNFLLKIKMSFDPDLVEERH